MAMDDPEFAQLPMLYRVHDNHAAASHSRNLFGPHKRDSRGHHQKHTSLEPEAMLLLYFPHNNDGGYHG
jgi:hypothetical protein